MQDFLDYVKYEDLDEDDRELADCIGLEGFKNLVRTFGGSHINVKIPRNLGLKYRNAQIISEFNGENYKQLAIKYNLSDHMIRYIVYKHYKNSKQAEKH